MKTSPKSSVKKRNLSKNLWESALKDELMRVGFMHQAQGDLELAAEYYIRSIERRPTAEAHTFLGVVFRQMGEIDQAIEECREALKLDPNHGNALSDLAACLIDKKQYRKALPLLKKACRAKHYGSPAIPHFNLARLYLRQSQLLACQKSLLTALDEDPEFKPAKEILNDVKMMLH